MQKKSTGMKLNWNFLGGGGYKTKHLPWGSMEILTPQKIDLTK